MSFKNSALKLGNRAVYWAAPGRRLPTFYGGNWIWLGRRTWSSLYLAYEPLVAKAVREHLKPGSTFWDVGANIGLFSLLAAPLVGRSGCVVCFEPAPEVFELLQENVEGRETITAVQCGIGNTDGCASMSVQGTSTANSFIPEAVELTKTYLPDVPVQTTMVPIRKLDTLLKAHSRSPALLKIDIEGYEVEALKGASLLLGRVRPAMVIEVHPVQLRLAGASEEELLGLLRHWKYNVQTLSQNAFGLYSILAKPT